MLFTTKLFFLGVLALSQASLLASLIDHMTLEEKVGQMLFVHFHGTYANTDAATLIQQVKVGGIVYYNWCNSLHSPDQIRNLSQSLQDLTQENRFPIPLLLSIDEEGGNVSRLLYGFPPIPDNRTVGASKNPEKAEQLAWTRGLDMRGVGINMNFAPVVDVSSDYSLMKKRCYSHDPETVAAFGEKALQGYNKAHIIATLKHFPGHGDATTDSHISLPVIAKTLDELEQKELVPFRKLASQADVIMAGHLLVPALDSCNCTTLSPLSLDFLRSNIGFQGVIISDSLAMHGILSQCKSVDDAAIKALLAGCDLILLGGQQAPIEVSYQDVVRIHALIVQEAEAGNIPLAKIDAAVNRILNLKARLGLPPSPLPQPGVHFQASSP